MRFIHGHDLIGEELIKIASTTQILSTFNRNIKNSKLKHYVSSRLNFKSSNIKKLTNRICEIKLLDKVKPKTVPEYVNAYKK